MPPENCRVPGPNAIQSAARAIPVTSRAAASARRRAYLCGTASISPPKANTIPIGTPTRPSEASPFGSASSVCAPTAATPTPSAIIATPIATRAPGERSLRESGMLLIEYLVAFAKGGASGQEVQVLQADFHGEIRLRPRRRHRRELGGKHEGVSRGAGARVRHPR